MTLGELKRAVDDAIVSGGESMPVIVKDDSTVGVTWWWPAGAATKRGNSFRIYIDDSKREGVPS